MNNPELFYCSKREEWRAWLSEHFDTCDEIWFVFPTKDSGEESLSYNDAVEQALCFGWIDGRAGTLDDKTTSAVLLRDARAADIRSRISKG